jgi:putative oxidoreductase
MKNVTLFVARVLAGSLVAGHGAQKLFGWFEGPGLKGWTAAAGHMNMRPPRFWALTGALGEFGGGLLTALGFLNPIGPITMGSMMLAASYKGHWGKPVWAAKGGAELSLSFFASAALAATHGPGSYSLDSLFGIKLPRWVGVAALVLSAGMLAETIRPTVVPRFLPATPPAGDAVQPQS